MGANAWSSLIQTENGTRKGPNGRPIGRVTNRDLRVGAHQRGTVPLSGLNPRASTRRRVSNPSGSSESRGRCSLGDRIKTCPAPIHRDLIPRSLDGFRAFHRERTTTGVDPEPATQPASPRERARSRATCQPPSAWQDRCHRHRATRQEVLTTNRAQNEVAQLRSSVPLSHQPSEHEHGAGRAPESGCQKFERQAPAITGLRVGRQKVPRHGKVWTTRARAGLECPVGHDVPTSTPPPKAVSSAPLDSE